jgi:transcription elongation factor GreA
MEKIPMTQKGYDILSAELKQLKEIDRPKVIDDISEARAHGDLKENAEYHAAREKQSFIEGRIKELEVVLSRSDIIDHTTFTGKTVKFGATVGIFDETTEQESTYIIVGHYEANTKANKLSLQAPMSRALIGKSVGDVVAVQTPNGAKKYEIISVSFEAH